MKSLSVWGGWMKELKSSLQSEYFLVIQWIQCEYGTLPSLIFGLSAVDPHNTT